jgi:[ribosomal protein S18]-alanine N-acetyltransferase
MSLGRPATRTDLPAIHVAPMRRRHLRSVMRIDAQVYPRPWSQSLYQGELDQPEAKRVYLVARVGREVVGHAGLVFVLDQGHVTTVAVDPAWQGRGVGTRLMLVLVREAVARGATALTLEVRAGNQAAQALYRRFGFDAAGTRAGYYAESGEDAVIMWANEIDSDAYRQRLDQIDAAAGAAVVDHLAAARAERVGRRS